MSGLCETDSIIESPLGLASVKRVLEDTVKELLFEEHFDLPDGSNGSAFEKTYWSRDVVFANRLKLRSTRPGAREASPVTPPHRVGSEILRAPA